VDYIPLSPAFHEACAKAQKASEKDHCTIHVNMVARVSMSNRGSICITYRCSDWYVDGATLRSYTRGLCDDF
jgi:hypothetical protein